MEVYCAETLHRLPAEVNVPAHVLRRNMVAAGVAGRLRREIAEKQIRQQGW